jgi:type I restriction enzyme S subunit
MTETPVLHAAEETLEAVHTRRHATYPAYKPSGVEWLGDVPNHWDVKRLKFLSRINPSASEVMGLRDEDEVSFVPMDAVGEYGGMRLNIEKRLDEVRSGFTYFRDEDVVIAKITPCFENGKGSIARHLTNGVAFGTTELHVVRTGSKLVARFLFYLTISDAFRRLGASEMYGAGGQKRVPTDFVRDFPVGLPPLEEQQAIARFLDEQTRKIDDLIEAKRSLLDLLKEKRQTVITHAVTRGLDPAAKLKPSGVEWLGDVPEHWDVKPLKRLVGKIGSGKTPRGGSQVYVSSGVMLLRSQNVYDDGLRLGDVVFIDEDTDEEMSGTRVKSGDVLLNITGASIGRSSLVPDGIPKANVNQHVCIIRPTKISAAFLHAIICSKGIKNTIASEESGTSREGLNFRQVGRMSLPLPPLEEQQAIVRFLEEETEKIDDLESVVREAIETLELLRAGIISAAVTGKIDVREEGV